MASCPSPPPPTSISHRRHHMPCYGSLVTTTYHIILSSSAVCLHRSFPLFPLKTNSFGRCHATSPGPPPQSEPPSNKLPPSSADITSTFSKFQDTVQIFVAVLFWMSLFFWSSAWDGRNRGRPNKGSQFKK